MSTGGGDVSLSEEQRLLKESADRFVANEYSFERRRELAGSGEGFSREVWSQFAELGWLGVVMPEDHGGLGGSVSDVAVLLEALGRGLVVEPYVPTVLLGGGLVAAAGNDDQKAALIPPLVEGGLMLAFAYAEPRSRFNLAEVATRAEKDGRGYVLRGHKSVVFNAAAADKIVVTARTAGGSRDAEGITLFIVDGEAEGLSKRSYATQDGLRAAEVSLDGVRVGADAVLGGVDQGLPVVERVVDTATVAVCAEAVGAMDALVAMTREHLNTRKQFGVTIGHFQVLQHALVDMFTELELSRAITYRAAGALGDDDAQGAARAASAAKVRTGKGGRLVGQNAVQLHGGMGMAEELAVGHYFKRLSMIDVTFGNAGFHLKRFAGLGATV